ncbi:MFS general substrate transporter [Aspergillus steynii IBT 23096]|uniref:Citrate exporter 1 n=1 Tax=Aspergillus steynii IBT 23096 TaxID=1392250 RepID=A0A2I2FXT2_9EURO|nr:MFS general substrate transporter [Aspergillus steynii IBT 23096]PLB45422.1 MFS general substrate transporter [Aspergillus steynii IBT 23096]
MNEPRRRIHSVFSERQKKFSIIISSLVSFLAPVSESIYYPAIGSLADDLDVSRSDINFTITAFMIVQGVIPLFTGTISDRGGRRPVLLVCLSIYLIVNVGLALQTSFPALTTLRCFQSIGSSGTTVVAIATTSDLVTRAERGKYMAYSSMGYTVGPALGPILGGVLTRYLGWRSVFWFLAILTAVIILVILLFLRETCRAVVGNGSLLPQPWNQPVLEVIRPHTYEKPDYDTRVSFPKGSVFLDSVRAVKTKAMGMLVLGGTLLFCGSIAVTSSIPALLERKYGFDSLRIGLCYLPYAAGGIAARWTMGTLMDWNFRRHGRKVGVEVQRNQQTAQQLREIPLERVRLQLTLPLVYLSSICMLGYGWIMNYDVHIAGPLVILFLLGNANTAVNNSLNALIVDLNAYQPATAVAVTNLFKFLSGAGIVAGVLPLIDVVGIGWVGTIIAGFWCLISPLLWLLYVYGHEWRKIGDV